MKKRILILAFLFISINTFSQVTDSIKQINSLQKGSWSVQFEVGSDFKLSSFEGAMVSLKYHFSPKIALRFGAGFSGNNIDQRVEFRDKYYEYYGNEPVTKYSYNIFLTSNFLYYLKHDSKINVFLGIGPRAGLINNYSERLYIDGYLGILDVESWAAGLNGVFGCEWFPVPYLSLLAEYSVYGVIGKTSRKDWTYEISTGYRVEYYNTYSTDFEFKGNIVKLGLSLYF